MPRRDRDAGAVHALSYVCAREYIYASSGYFGEGVQSVGTVTAEVRAGGTCTLVRRGLCPKTYDPGSHAQAVIAVPDDTAAATRGQGEGSGGASGLDVQVGGVRPQLAEPERGEEGEEDEDGQSQEYDYEHFWDLAAAEDAPSEDELEAALNKARKEFAEQVHHTLFGVNTLMCAMVSMRLEAALTVARKMLAKQVRHTLVGHYPTYRNA